MRFDGCDPIKAIVDGFAKDVTIGVLAVTGQIVLTQMPSLASFTANARVSATIAHSLAA